MTTARTDSSITTVLDAVGIVSSGGFGVPTFEEMERQDIEERPSEVFHPWAETMGPKFKTWPEARNAAKEWNRECPGHVARKRRFFPSPNIPDEPRR